MSLFERLKPETPYQRSKLTCEKLLGKYSNRYGFKCIAPGNSHFSVWGYLVNEVSKCWKSLIFIKIRTKLISHKVNNSGARAVLRLKAEAYT